MEEEIRENKGKEIGLRDLQKILVRCWWIMIAAAIILAGVTFLFLRITHKDVYTAKAKIWVMRKNTTIQEGMSIKNTTDVSIANNIIPDVVDVAKNNLDVKEAVEQETGLSLKTATLRVSSAEELHIVEISVTSESPEEAYTLANSLRTQTCAKINYLMEGEEGAYAKPYESIEKPEKPSNPISKLTILLAGFIGAVVIYAVFFVLYLTDDKINDAEDVQTHLGISVLGEIPNERDVSTHRKRYGSYYYRRYKAYQAPTEQQGGNEQ